MVLQSYALKWAKPTDPQKKNSYRIIAQKQSYPPVSLLSLLSGFSLWGHSEETLAMAIPSGPVNNNLFYERLAISRDASPEDIKKVRPPLKKNNTLFFFLSAKKQTFHRAVQPKFKHACLVLGPTTSQLGCVLTLSYAGLEKSSFALASRQESRGSECAREVHTSQGSLWGILCPCASKIFVGTWWKIALVRSFCPG